MLLKKITRIFSETGMPCISKNRVFLKISGLNLIFFTERMSDRKDRYKVLLYNRNKLNIWFICRVRTKDQIIRTSL